MASKVPTDINLTTSLDDVIAERFARYEKYII